VLLLFDPSAEGSNFHGHAMRRQTGCVDSFGAGHSSGQPQSLAGELEQDLSPRQGDVGAFETNERSSTLGYLRGNAIINVRHESKAARFEKNAAAGGAEMVRHDS
jgi:hypothetical protein